MDQVIDAVAGMMQAWTDMPVRRAVLPAAECVCIEKGTSDVITTALNRSTCEEIACVLNCKSQTLSRAMDAVQTMHQRLSRYPVYPATEEWQITAVETISGPTVIGREAGGYWVVSSTIRVKYYNKEGAF